MTFFEALLTQNFIQYALVTALLCGLVCGLMGPVVVVRNLSSAAGGIAHAVVGGMGFFAWIGLPVMAGAFVAAIVVALFLGVPRNANDGNSDARVQVIWSIGMALGIVFLALTPGYAVDLMSYLFGNLLLSSVQSILWTGAVAVGLIGLYGWRFRCIETICFDEEFARVIGLPVRPMNIVIYIATALSVVVLIQSVGLILVISLMTIPSLIAFALSRSLAQMIGIAIMLNSVFAFVGLWVSYVYDLPSGASIILCAGAAYLAWQVARHCRRALRSSPGDRGAVLSGSQPNS